MTDQQAPTAKILFQIPEDDGTVEVETLWAFDQGGDKFKVDNVPCFAYSVSLHDIVYAPFDPAERFHTFQKVVEKSGNRTIRVIFEPPISENNRSHQNLQRLISLGCDPERANDTYVALNIPPAVLLSDVVDFLVAADLEWEHADPRYDELYPDHDI